jgi:hypothetical protein
MGISSYAIAILCGAMKDGGCAMKDGGPSYSPDAVTVKGIVY